MPLLYLFRGFSAKRFAQIPSLSISVKFKCTNVPWEPKMLIGRLCCASIDFGIRGSGLKLSAWHWKFDWWKPKCSLAAPLTKPSYMGHIWPKHGNDMTWPMALLWVICGFCMGCCFPHQTHTCYCPLDDLHSIVFYYGISTYFALPHTFPIASTMGMVWV